MQRAFRIQEWIFYVGRRTLEVVCRVDDIGPLPSAVRHVVDKGTCQSLRIRPHKGGATALAWLHPFNRLVGGDQILRVQLREQGKIMLTVLRGPDNLTFRAQALCSGSEMRTQGRIALETILKTPRPWATQGTRPWVEMLVETRRAWAPWQARVRGPSCSKV